MHSSSKAPRRTTAGPLGLWLPAAVYACGIFVVSSLSQAPLPRGVSDKTGHRTAYGGFGLVVLRALAHGEWAGVTPVTAAAAVGMATVYGVTDEVHQSFVPGRSADVGDVLADATGAGSGVLVAWAIAALRRRREGRI